MKARRGRAPLFMVHVVPGLEELAWEELRELDGDAEAVATWSGIDRRAGVLLFRSREPLASLLGLRLTEDLFAVAGIAQLPEGTRALKAISNLARTAGEMDAALRFHREAFPARRPARPAFRVVARKSGHHRFRRIDAQQACEAGIGRRFPRWRLVEDGGLEFWLQVVAETAVLALRLSSPEMRHRAYLDVSLPAALKPAVAHALVRLSAVPTGGLLIDPMCGAGTIAAEAVEGRRRALAGDSDPQAVRAARQNLGGGRYANVLRWDVARLPLRDRAVDGFACNLPWGRQQGVEDLTALYRRFLAEARRVVREGGRVAVLTAESELFERIVRRGRRFAIDRRIAVVVKGVDANLFVLVRRD